MTSNGSTVRGKSVFFESVPTCRYGGRKSSSVRGLGGKSAERVPSLRRGAQRGAFAKSVACRLAKRAVGIVSGNLNNIYMSVAGAALGLAVFFVFSVLASGERGGTGLGGEVIAAAAVMLAFKFFWKRIRGKLKD